MKKYWLFFALAVVFLSAGVWAQRHGGNQHQQGTYHGHGMMGYHHGHGMMGCPMMMPASPKGVSPEMLRERAQMMREMAQEMEDMAEKMESGRVTQEEWSRFREDMWQKCRRCFRRWRMMPHSYQ